MRMTETDGRLVPAVNDVCRSLTNAPTGVEVAPLLVRKRGHNHRLGCNKPEAHGSRK